MKWDKKKEKQNSSRSIQMIDRIKPKSKVKMQNSGEKRTLMDNKKKRENKTWQEADVTQSIF